MLDDLDDDARRALVLVLLATSRNGALSRHLKYLHDQKDHGRRGPKVVSDVGFGATDGLRGVTDGVEWEFSRRESGNLTDTYFVKIAGQERIASGQMRRDVDTAYRKRERDKADALRVGAAGRAAKAERDNQALREKYEREGTPVFVRFGAVGRGHRSRNARDDRLEAGLSVYAGWQLPDGRVGLDMRGVDAVSLMFGGFGSRPMYTVTGKRIATGSDGEPILDPNTFALKKAGTDEADILT